MRNKTSIDTFFDAFEVEFLERPYIVVFLAGVFLIEYFLVLGTHFFVKKFLELIKHKMDANDRKIVTLHVAHVVSDVFILFVSIFSFIYNLQGKNETLEFKLIYWGGASVLIIAYVYDLLYRNDVPRLLIMSHHVLTIVEGVMAIIWYDDFVYVGSICIYSFFVGLELYVDFVLILYKFLKYYKNIYVYYVLRGVLFFALMTELLITFLGQQICVVFYFVYYFDEYILFWKIFLPSVHIVFFAAQFYSPFVFYVLWKKTGKKIKNLKREKQIKEQGHSDIKEYKIRKRADSYAVSYLDVLEMGQDIGSIFGKKSQQRKSEISITSATSEISSTDLDLDPSIARRRRKSSIKAIARNHGILEEELIDTSETVEIEEVEVFQAIKSHKSTNSSELSYNKGDKFVIKSPTEKSRDQKMMFGRHLLSKRNGLFNKENVVESKKYLEMEMKEQEEKKEKKEPALARELSQPDILEEIDLEDIELYENKMEEEKEEEEKEETIEIAGEDKKEIDESGEEKKEEETKPNEEIKEESESGDSEEEEIEEITESDDSEEEEIIEESDSEEK